MVGFYRFDREQIRLECRLVFELRIGAYFGQPGVLHGAGQTGVLHIARADSRSNDKANRPPGDVFVAR